METYTITQLTKMTGIPSSTLRYYEQEGLLKNVGRTPTGQRIYTGDHVKCLDQIGCFKGAGMSLSELRRFLRYEENLENSTDDMLALLENRRSSLRKQIREQMAAYEHLLCKLDYYTAVKQAVESGKERPRWGEYKKKRYPLDL
ncbi:MAG: MerR family transcriptional regulator [Lachnospiraceae bacterium]|nr:MerR family transcriptional regulator [Lachnospiraceae bacterium]